MPDRYLLRILRRLSSIEPEATVDSFFATEFCCGENVDLNLSVFDIEAERLVQAHAEYAASFRTPDRKLRGGLELEVTSETLTQTPAGTQFRFTRESHREIEFLRPSEARAFAERVFTTLASRMRHAKPEELQKYVRARLENADGEWTTLCMFKPKWDPRPRPVASTGSAEPKAPSSPHAPNPEAEPSPPDRRNDSDPPPPPA
jgi:hypothetical protein